MPNTNKEISVIIPSKNRVQFTIEAIKSVLKQNLNKKFTIEIIVVDDGSDEPLKPILFKQFGQKVKVIRNNISKGPGGSRNVGLKYAKGDFIAFLDNDDKWKNNFILNSINILTRTKAPASVCLTNPYFWGSFLLNQKIKIIFLNLVRMGVLVFFWLFNKGKLPKSGFYLCQISHILFNCKFIKNIRFNEKTVAAEDWEFNVDATLEKEFSIIPKPLVDFRYEMKSNTFNPKVKKGKEKAYLNLLNKIPMTHKKAPLYQLFKWYIKTLLIK